VTARETVTGSRHAIAAGHHVAADAGFEVLEAGGNAADAAVTAGLVLAVVQPDIVQLAGVAPIMAWRAGDRRLTTIDGLGTWPAATDIALFEETCDGHIPEGVLRTVVPAAPDAWLTLLEHFGTMSFAEVAGPAIAHARDGFPMYPFLAEGIARHAGDYARWPENARVYLPDGRPPEVGATFRQPDLAATLTFLADESGGKARTAGIEAARRAVHEGDIAREVARLMESLGGWLTRADMAAYRVREERPVAVEAFGLDLRCCGPWCQGPALAQAAVLFEGCNPASLGHNSVAYLHHLAEALDLAFADREAHVGDPRHVEVPIQEMLDPAYLARRRGLIDAGRAHGRVPPPGDPRRGAATRDAPSPVESAQEPTRTGDTSYLAVVDRWGNAVSATPSDVSYQSPMVPGTGLVPSMRGAQSWGRRDHPSAAAPGKRPRLTPNPAMALKDGEPALVLGTPGGDVQTQAMLQVLANVQVFGMDLQAACEAPRAASFNFPNSFEPHAYLPGRLMLEAGLAADQGDRLADMGHDVGAWPADAWQAGSVCVLRIDRQRGLIEAAADPRRPTGARAR